MPVAPNSAQDDIIGILGIFVFLIFAFSESCEAQTAGKYEFYRYDQRYAVEIDPLGEILGRVSAQFEDRLDPNFSRVYEFVYQKNVGDKSVTGYYPESAISLAAIERIYLVDNAAMLGQYVGVGAGIGLINETISLRMTAEIGYKFVFGGGKGNYFIEPRLMMDAYLITNHDGKPILPYVSLPFGYAWW
jgi:hypothetical protein